jgi:L-asparaginase
VEQGRYATSKELQAMGVVPGADITVEAAVAKLMFLLGKEQASEAVERALAIPTCGEFTLA